MPDDVASSVPPARADARRKFTWAEVNVMAALNLFGERQPELIGGDVCVMPEEGFLHVAQVRTLQNWLMANLAPLGLFVAIREPIHFSDDTVLIPDLAVYPSDLGPEDATAAKALLVIEVADTTLERDRKWKLPLYAAAGAREVWLIDAPKRTLAVHRAPEDGAWTYVRTHLPGDPATPLCGEGCAFDPGALPQS